MKTFFKRSAISVIVIGMASSAFAASPQPANDSFSPAFTGVFIGVEGLYLRPQNGDLDYVTVSPAAVGQAIQTHNISPDYSWDWRVYGGIKFTDNDDITASWMSMRNSETDHFLADGSVNSNPRWLYNGDWQNVAGKVNFDLDDAYLVWGHTVNFNNPWSVRFGVGVEYAKLDSDLTVSAWDPVVEDAFVGFTSESNLKGIGPRAEVDLTYHLPYGFALYGKANVAALVSEREVNLTPTLATYDGDDYYGHDYSDRRVVVPKVGMRLGASYSYTFGQAGGEGPCRTTTLTLDAGWQVESYIHAIERVEDSTISSSILGMQSDQITVGQSDTKTSNFGNQGLFVGLKVSSDWM